MDCFVALLLAMTVSADLLKQINRFCLTGKSPNCCPALFAKIFPFAPDPNQLHIPHRLVPNEGRIAIVTDAGRDAVDARASGAHWQSQGEMNLVSELWRARRSALERTAKPCGPGTRCWC